MMGMPMVFFSTGWACPWSPLPLDGHAHTPLCYRMGMPMVPFFTGWACPWPSFLIHGYAHSLLSYFNFVYQYSITQGSLQLHCHFPPPGATPSLNSLPNASNGAPPGIHPNMLQVMNSGR